MANYTRFQLRGDTKANWLSVNPILAKNEPAIETDTKRFKIGDGVSTYSQLSYGRNTSEYASLYNVTSLFPLPSGYYSHESAVLAIPVGERIKGLIITYETASGVWYTERFIGTNVSGWTTLSNWEKVPDASDVAQLRSDLNELDADYSNTFGDGSINSDFSIEDEKGSIIMEIKDGRIRTKDSPLYPLDNESEADFDIQDTAGNSTMRIIEGVLETGKPPLTPLNNDSNADLDFKDKYDNSVFKILNGYPYSGNFDGNKIKLLSDDYERKYKSFEPFILDAVPAQNIGNVDREFDLNNITVTSFYAKWNELISESNGYITKTVLGLDASNTYEIWRLDLSSQNYNGKLTNSNAIDIKAKKKVYIHAGLHGDTYDPNNHIFMLYWIAKCLVNNYRTNSLWAKIRKEYDFVFIPIANPWGIEHPQYAYGQSQNINIDRNWDWNFKPNDSASWATYATSGTEPFSCVESQYLRDVLLSIKDDLTFAIDLHSHSRYYNMGRIILLDRHTLFSDILYDNAKRVMQYTGDMVDNQLCQVAWQDCYGNSGGYIPNVLGVPSYIVECQCAEYNVTNYNQMYSSNALTADLYVILASILNF